MDTSQSNDPAASPSSAQPAKCLTHSTAHAIAADELLSGLTDQARMLAISNNALNYFINSCVLPYVPAEVQMFDSLQNKTPFEVALSNAQETFGTLKIKLDSGDLKPLV